MNRRSTQAARGSVSAELAVLAPVLLLVLLLVAAAGRIATVRAEVDGAARDAARAATLARSAAAAHTAAQDAAAAALSTQRCQEITVRTDTSAWRPGGWATVTVACTLSLADLSLLRLPGHQTLTGRFTHPVDQYRQVSVGIADIRAPKDSNFELGEIGG